ncbi:hypothetical protein [Pelotomaculum schinkii]|uniref:hypothetical protein n=1 Tax=Pelotomaculum schinkii TaxID=78350 RepID=UPI00167C92C9|nr:hypothetical protein [Pelotomaculum schinkii]
MPGQGKLLAGQAEAWVKSLSGQTGGLGFRTCFRLEPPPDPVDEGQKPQKKGIHRGQRKDENRDWFLSFHLQASDDPSLLIPAEVVWKESKTSLRLLGRKFENPQERLLADLGRAARFG